jgi:O-antigen/teichoic acid export membrane protein
MPRPEDGTEGEAAGVAGPPGGEPGRPPSAPSGSSGFRSKVLEGVGWSAAGLAARVGFGAGTLMLLSRLVDPATMGLYGVAWAATSLGYQISRFGAAQGIISMPAVDKPHVAAAHVLGAMLALVIGLSLAFAAPALERFYELDGLGEAFLIGGLFVPLMCLPAVDMALAQKELNFRRLIVLQTLGLALASVTAVGFALAGHGLIALFALQGCIGPYTFILFRMAGQPLGLVAFRMAHVRDVWKIGVHLSFNCVTGAALLSLPVFIMAKFLSAEALGIYTFCDRIVQLLAQQLGGMFFNVVYPAFSSIQSDLARIGRAYIASARYTVFALFLCLLVLVVAPGPFLVLFGGEQWRSGATVLSFLAIAQMMACLGFNVFPTFMAIGRPSAAWIWNVFLSVVQGAVVYALARHGIDAVAKGLVLPALLTPIAPYLLSRALGFPFMDYVTALAGIVLPVVPAIALGIALSAWIGDLAPLAAFLIPASAAGTGFLGLVLVADRRLRRELGPLVSRGRWP